MIAALISGSLYRAPELRTAKTGRQFVTATLRAKEGESSQFVRITAFSESVQAELLRLQDGDALSVQGRLTVETFITTTGAHKVSLSLVAENVLTLRQPPKKREPKTKPASSSAQERERAFDDSIPF
jgi:single-stranded DNA-binding protein